MKKDLATLKQEYEAAITRSRGYIALKHVTAPLNVASGAYVKALEQRVKDLETVLKTGHMDMEARPGTYAELGHERGLDMLQWLNNGWSHDVGKGVPGAFAGIRHFVAADEAVLNALAEREYVVIVERNCFITPAGMNYLTALKQEVFGK